MPKPKPLEKSDPPSVKVRLAWLEVSGTGTTGIVAAVILVLVIWGARFLPVW